MNTEHEKKLAPKVTYYAANRDKVLARMATYYEANRERIQAHVAAYQAENREGIKARSANYRAMNPEKINACKAACRARNRENSRAYDAAYYAANSDKRAAYYQANKDRIKASAAAYRAANPDRDKARNAAYYAANSEKVKACKAAWAKNRYRTDPNFRLRLIIRVHLRRIVKSGGVKDATSLSYVGCTVAQLRKHLERQFKPGMTWQNHGEWHIDHITPLAAFDFAGFPAQIKQAQHYTNLRPMWAEDNQRKCDTLPYPVQLELIAV